MADPSVKKALKKLCPVLLEGRERNLNEADTRIRVVRLLSDVLGYDELTEITSEQRIKRRYVDFAIKIDGVIKFLIEVKGAAVTLRDRFIEQSQRYASEGNIRWVILTNGVVWNLYHLTFEEGIDYERAFSVDLSSDPPDQAATFLGHLHRKAILKGKHETFWKERLALNPQSLGRALFAEEVLRLIRREVRRQEGFLIDIEDLAKALQGMFTPEARQQMGPVKVRGRQKPKRKQRPRRPASQAKSKPSTDEAEQPQEPEAPEADDHPPR